MTDATVLGGVSEEGSGANVLRQAPVGISQKWGRVRFGLTLIQ